MHEGLRWDFVGNEKLGKKEPTFCMQAIFARANRKTREYNTKDIHIHVSPQFQKRLYISAVSTENNDKATIFIK